MSGYSRIVNRLIGALNSNAPNGIVTSARDWVDSWNQANLNLRSVQPSAWYENIESPIDRFVDFSNIKSVTAEDRLLKASVALNCHTRSRQKDLFCIHDARVLGGEGAIISPDNKLFCEFTYNSGDCLDNSIFSRKRIPKLEHRQGNFTTLVYPDSANYYHWLIESLPNLRFLTEILPTLDGIFVPELKQFHLDTLTSLGIAREKLIPLDSNSHYQCDRLYVTSFSYGYYVMPEITRWLRNSYLPAITDQNIRKLFISRNDSSSRKVTNETEVMNLLKPYGYDLIKPASLSFVDQAKLFDSAQTIIAPHGAGLTNIAFCKPGTRVLEIFPPRWTPCCYLQLSQAAQLDYNFMIAEPPGTHIDEFPQFHGFEPIDVNAPNREMDVPLDKLEVFCQEN
jgi:hypothetical protein